MTSLEFIAKVRLKYDIKKKDTFLDGVVWRCAEILSDCVEGGDYGYYDSSYLGFLALPFLSPKILTVVLLVKRLLKSWNMIIIIL